MRILATSILCLLMAACSSTPTPSYTYLLRSDASMGSSGQLTPSNVTLVSVEVATYIDQPGIVMQTESGQIKAAKYNQWAEPLRHSLKGYLASEISSQFGKTVNAGSYKAGEDSTRLIVRIDQLHGNLEGDAVLVAEWTLRSIKEAKTEETSYRLALSEPLQLDGYHGLVEAEKQLLDKLAKAIADTL